MFSFFEGIVAFITTLVNFVINLVEILVFILLAIFRSVTWLFGCISYLPPFLVAFVVVPVAIAIIFQVINKGS
ncbi:hypothetical protein B5E84_00570 [Lachnoclostridium sp. An14]|uniref:hypothetical protein n=1 Tax=Lachnoclostridium sp. An14 TaxID=1965562 RepID=UPI000B393211|nr:hypothetical protein [Lachnoclostridium sp. An14]OUQ21791.1 hypothetical protein B5E84_00570 [Lachnoclostridium sp. An14]